MKKKISLFAVVCISIIAVMSLVGCGGKKEDYSYEFAFEGGQVLYKSNSIYEVLKDNKTIGYIRANGESKDDGVYVEEKIENRTISIYILATYDREKFMATSPNATLTKQIDTSIEDINEITQYTPFIAVPEPNDPYYFVQNYSLSKNSKENINISISGLELFSAMNYNWELCAVGKVVENVEDITIKDSIVYIDFEPLKVGEDLQVNLNLKSDSKTLYIKFMNEAETVAIQCKFENDNYLVSFDDQQLTANIVTSNNVGLTNRQLLKMQLGNDIFAYLIKKV